ncbi:MAG: hypothetical protein ACRCZO_19925, partial [Cetobacterium sp.]
SSHGVEFTFEELDTLAVWTSVDSSEFICLEPWAGITDFTENSNRVEKKKHIQKLNSNEQKKHTQIIRVY